MSDLGQRLEAEFMAWFGRLQALTSRQLNPEDWVGRWYDNYTPEVALEDGPEAGSHQETDGRLPAAQGRAGDPSDLSLCESPPSGRSSLTQERLISAADLQGAMAFYATVQHPYRDPPKLARMVALIQEWAEHDFESVGTFCTRRFPSSRDLWKWLDERCVFSQEATAILTEWNTPRSQHKAQYVVSSRYGGPAAEHDFIDIVALTGNIARMAWKQAAEFERACVSDENTECEDRVSGLRSEGLPARCHEVADAQLSSSKARIETLETALEEIASDVGFLLRAIEEQDPYGELRVRVRDITKLVRDACSALRSKGETGAPGCASQGGGDE